MQPLLEPGWWYGCLLRRDDLRTTRSRRSCCVGPRTSSQKWRLTFSSGTGRPTSLGFESTTGKRHLGKQAGIIDRRHRGRAGSIVIVAITSCSVRLPISTVTSLSAIRRAPRSCEAKARLPRRLLATQRRLHSRSASVHMMYPQSCVRGGPRLPCASRKEIDSNEGNGC